MQQSHTGKSWKSAALLSAKSKVKDFYEQMRGIRLIFQAGAPLLCVFGRIYRAKMQMGRNKKMHICEIKKYGETSFSSAKNILQKDFT